MKPPKSKTLAARARKLPKFIRVKPRKKIGAEIATVKRKRTRSVFRRVKSALRRLGGTKHRVGTRKRSIRLIPAKARPRKTTKIRLIRAHASMRFFSAGRAVRVTVSRKTASVVGSYLASVRKLLDTNDPRATGQFTGRSVKDVRGNIYPLETNPNTLYRLNASVEPFEEVYRLLA